MATVLFIMDGNLAGGLRTPHDGGGFGGRRILGPGEPMRVAAVIFSNLPEDPPWHWLPH